MADGFQQPHHNMMAPQHLRGLPLLKIKTAAALP